MKTVAKTNPQLVLGLAALNTIIPISYWLAGLSGRFHSATDIIQAFGRLSGLMLATAVLYQFLLMSRLPVIERKLGAALQYKLHRWNGYLIFYLLLGHAGLLLIGYAVADKLSLWSQLLSFINDYEDVLKAVIAFLLFIFVIVMSIRISRSKLPYEWWYVVHLSVYIAIIFAWGHQLHVGTDFLNQPLFVAYWYLFYGVVAVAVGWWRFILPSYRSYKYGFKVERVVPETTDTVSIYVQAKGLPADYFVAGQYASWRFLNNRYWWQAHPFSFSTATAASGLRLTVKASGDYTDDLVKNLKPGAPIFLDGPHGQFTLQGDGRRPLFIAGGVGITPLRSMIEALGDEAAGAALIYAVRNPESRALGDELEDIVQRTGMKIHYVYSESSPAGAEKGLVDQDRIKRLVPDISTRSVYLCGPPPMMTAVRKSLTDLSVPGEFIYSEAFEYQPTK